MALYEVVKKIAEQYNAEEKKEPADPRVLVPERHQKVYIGQPLQPHTSIFGRSCIIGVTLCADRPEINASSMVRCHAATRPVTEILQ